MSFAPRRADATVPDDERVELIMPDSNAVAVYSDLRCPWAHVAVHRLLTAVEHAGLGGEIAIDHRAAPLELAGDVDVEELVAAAELLSDAVPEALWEHRFDDAGSFPRSSLRALAHVQAAKAASPEASVALDRELRHKLWSEGRDIDDPSVIAEAVAQVPDLDPQRLADELDSGRPEAEIQRHADAAGDLVAASPTLVLPNGTSWTNPGIETSRGDHGPVLERDDPTVYDEILDRFLALRTYD